MPFSVPPGVKTHTALTDTTGQWIVLSDTILGSAAANVDITSITNYPEYQLIISTKASGATARGCFVTFNGDAGANYQHAGTSVWNSGANTAAAGDAAANGCNTGNVSQTAGVLGIISMFITNPAAAMTKGYTSQNFSTATAATSDLYNGIWGNTAAVINQMTVALDADNLDTGTRVILMGRSVA